MSDKISQGQSGIAASPGCGCGRRLCSDDLWQDHCCSLSQRRGEYAIIDKAKAIADCRLVQTMTQK